MAQTIFALYDAFFCMASKIGRNKNNIQYLKANSFLLSPCFKRTPPSTLQHRAISFSHVSTLGTPVQSPVLDLDPLPPSGMNMSWLRVSILGEPSWSPGFLTDASLLGIPTALSRRVYMQVLIESLVFLARSDAAVFTY